MGSWRELCNRKIRHDYKLEFSTLSPILHRGREAGNGTNAMSNHDYMRNPNFKSQ